MVLFDIVRNLNDKINYSINNGIPSKRVPYVVGVTDGYNVLIQFMGVTIWESTDWEYANADMDEVSELEYTNEIKRIEQYVTKECQKQVNMFFNIQLD